MEQLLANLRFAVRMLRRSPGFTTVAILTLALGVGANTAIFSIVNAVFLAPLPFSNSHQLVQIFATQDGQKIGPSTADAKDFAEQNHSLQNLVPYDFWRKNVSGIGGTNAPEEMAVGLVPPQYFEVLGIHPVMGRIFTDQENHYGNHYEVLINESFWRTRFGADPKVLGKRVNINDEPYTIIGVLPDLIPDWVNYGRNIVIWTPQEHRPSRAATEEDRQSRGWNVIGRLKSGVTLQQAQADLERIAATLAQQHPLDQGYGVMVRPLAESRAESLRKTLWLLVAAVGLILLIACSNIANLLLARNTARNREFALRSALGASRSILIRQLIVESLVLSMLGALAGLGLGWLGSLAVARFHPWTLAQLQGTTIDWRVMLFTLMVAILTGVLFGLMPAFSSTRMSLLEGLKEGGYTSSVGGRRQYFRRLIVVSEIAFSLMLVIGAALLVKSIIRLQAQQSGFSEDHLLWAHLYLPDVRYPDGAKRTEFCERLAENLRSVPGVLQASLTSVTPPSNRWRETFIIDGRTLQPQENPPISRFILTDANYIQTLRIPLLRGRGFTAADRDPDVAVALVNQEFARQYFPNRDLLGHRIRLTGSDVIGGLGAGTELTIVGVVGNTKNRGLAFAPDPEIVALFRQIPPLNFGFKDLIVRTASDPYVMARTIAQQIEQLDPDMPMAEVTSMEEIMSAQTRDARFTTGLLSLFAILGFALAIVGIYGVISYLVARRTHEIGIRMALGAQRANVLWLVLRQGLSLGLAGIVLGLYGAWQMGRAIQHLLWGISPADVATFSGASLVVIIVAALATLIPGVRATRIDPLLALRRE